MQLTGSTIIDIETCSRCGVANPAYVKVYKDYSFYDLNDHYRRIVACFRCTSCQEIILAETEKIVSSDVKGYFHALASNTQFKINIDKIFPEIKPISENIPDRPRYYLKAAKNTLHEPSASIVSSAAAIDSMLRDKGIASQDSETSLYQRIRQAVAEGILTQNMAEWAHAVRLDANAQRHADHNAAFPNREDANRVFELAQSLAEILYVIPEKARRYSPPEE